LGFTASPARLCGSHPPALGLPPAPTRSTVNRASAYSGRFLDADRAVADFERHITCYDTEHYHFGIDFVALQQFHLDLRPKDVAQRRPKQLAPCHRRRVENEIQKPATKKQTNTKA
jgi:hypothetical protein